MKPRCPVSTSLSSDSTRSSAACTSRVWATQPEVSATACEVHQAPSPVLSAAATASANEATTDGEMSAATFPALQAALGNEQAVDLTITIAFYNAVVRDLNIACEAFPSVLVAKSFGFSKRQYFEIADGERANVQVKL